MKVFGYNIFMYGSSEWGQLEVLWNREARYNWFDFTVFHLSWRSKRTKKLESTQESGAKSHKFPGACVEINLGLLGLKLTLIVAKSRP